MDPPRVSEGVSPPRGNCAIRRKGIVVRPRDGRYGRKTAEAFGSMQIHQQRKAFEEIMILDVLMLLLYLYKEPADF